jgi:hypothetical protein
MTQQNFDARQVSSEDTLTQLAAAASNVQLDNLLRSADKETTMPLRMRVTASDTVSIDSHIVQNPEQSRNRTIAPIQGSFTPPTFPITINIPASNGGNITWSTDPGFTALNIPNNLDYALVGVSIQSNGFLNITVGAPGPVIANLAYPSFPSGRFAIGMFVVQRNGAGFSALMSAGIYQFNGGIAAAILNPMTTTGDLIYSADNSGTPARLPIGANGQVLNVTAGLPVWTDLFTGATKFFNPSIVARSNIFITPISSPSDAFLGMDPLGATGAAILIGAIAPADDAGTVPVMIFSARRNTPTTVATRPLFSWWNYSTPVGDVDVFGQWSIGRASAGNSHTLRATTVTIDPGSVVGQVTHQAKPNGASGLFAIESRIQGGDSGAAPAMLLYTDNGSGGALGTRPVLSIQNGPNTYATLSAGGAWGLGQVGSAAFHNVYGNVLSINGVGATSLNVNSAAATDSSITWFINGGSYKGQMGAAGAASGIVSGSVAGDIALRANSANILMSVDAGATALLKLAVNQQVIINGSYALAYFVFAANATLPSNRSAAFFFSVAAGQTLTLPDSVFLRDGHVLHIANPSNNALALTAGAGTSFSADVANPMLAHTTQTIMFTTAVSGSTRFKIGS